MMQRTRYLLFFVLASICRLLAWPGIVLWAKPLSAAAEWFEERK